jgi:hypothetical protein
MGKYFSLAIRQDVHPVGRMNILVAYDISTFPLEHHVK